MIQKSQKILTLIFRRVIKNNEKIAEIYNFQIIKQKNKIYKQSNMNNKIHSKINYSKRQFKIPQTL